MLNWEPFPEAPHSIDAIVLTHAHIDHIGYLPRLVKEGYRGPVFCTRATAELAEILLRDTGHLQEEEARWANKKGYSRHRPALPLYTVQDAERVLPLLEPVSYGERFQPLPGHWSRFRDTGHILGSAFLEVWKDRDSERRKIVFSGDLGRPLDPMLRTPSQPYNVDYLILESTYGDRLHSPGAVREDLKDAVNAALDRGGPLLIPSFAVGRTQELLYLIRDLEAAGDIPEIPVYVDSPMAVRALEVHQRHVPDLNMVCRKQFIEGIDLFKPSRLRLVSSVQDSKDLVFSNTPARIVIAGSGMVTGGRILHHFRHHLPNPSTTVLFVGYQAVGTRGRSLRDGNDTLRMFGMDIRVRATVKSMDGFSGHADANEILAWLMPFNKPVERVFLVHGEPESAEALGKKMEQEFGWPFVIPRMEQSFDLNF